MKSNVEQLRSSSARIAGIYLILLSAVCGQIHAQTQEKVSELSPAREAFERFKKLEGKWKGRSTKGWEETISFKTIAAGSVVVENSFDAHPNETMMTMYHLDGDRLMLTHYCVAKNQPRLVATSFADGGKTITFTFLDGTNIPTRDRGHMDKVIVRFLDDNHVTSHWTWYQNGKESWIEEIQLERLSLRASAAEELKNANAEEQSLLRTHALKINVDNMKKALTFYVEKLGFEIEDRRAYPRRVTLKTGDRIKLILNKVERLQKVALTDTQVGLTLEVNDLDQAIARMKSAGVEFAETEPRKEAVGNAIFIRDPFGRKISLMHQTIVKVEPFKEPRIYNFGLLIPDMSVGRDFYANRLGFVVRSEKYLPKDLPLGLKDNSFGFMLHYRPGVQAVKSDYPRALPYYTIVFETDNLQGTVEAMAKDGIEIIRKQLPKNGKPATVVFRDPFGNISELEEGSDMPLVKN